MAWLISCQIDPKKAIGSVVLCSALSLMNIIIDKGCVNCEICITFKQIGIILCVRLGYPRVRG